LSLRTGSSTLPGVARLEITLSRSSCPRSNMALFEAVLQKVLDLGVSLEVTFDFREHPPGAAFTSRFARIRRRHSARWCRQVVSAALIIKDNIFAAVAGPVSRFMELCKLGAPVLVCHAKGSADEFFRAGHREPGPGPGPRAARGSAEPHAAAGFVSLVEITEFPEYLLARVESWRGSDERVSVEGAPPHSVAHVMPNGDVRVIQSAPQDIMFEIEPGTTGELPAQCPGPGALLRNAAALKFTCDMDRLMPFAGAHFHAGELVVDADAESAQRVLGEADSQNGIISEDCMRGIQEFLLDCADCIISLGVPGWSCHHFEQGAQGTSAADDDVDFRDHAFYKLSAARGGCKS